MLDSSVSSNVSKNENQSNSFSSFRRCMDCRVLGSIGGAVSCGAMGTLCLSSMHGMQVKDVVEPCGVCDTMFRVRKSWGRTSFAFEHFNLERSGLVYVYRQMLGTGSWTLVRSIWSTLVLFKSCVQYTCTYSTYLVPARVGRTAS